MLNIMTEQKLRNFNRSKKMMRFLLFVFLLFYSYLPAEEIKFTSLPENINKEYWQQLKKNTNRLIIPLSGEWQYQRWDSDEADGTVMVPGMAEYEGKIVYRKIITITQNLKDKDFYLHFNGVSFRAVVRFNNEYLGTIENSYIPTEFNIPRQMLLFDKENVIEVEVSGKTDFDLTIPTGPQFNLWDIHNGIFREVYLIASERVRIEDVKTYQTFAGKYTRAQIWTKTTIRKNELPAEMASSDETKKYYFEMAIFRNTSLVTRKQSYEFSFKGALLKQQTLSLTINDVKLWSPDKPALYQLRLSVFEVKSNELVDREWSTVGFKDLRINGNQFFLNGRNIKLKGVEYTQFFPNLNDMLALPIVKKDFMLIKSLGANAIINPGRPLPELALDLADQLGLFVLQEFPAYFTPGSRLGNRDFINKSSNLFKEMIVAGRNHPSVFAWGIGRNFDSQSPNAATYFSALKKIASPLDSRPLFLTTNLLINDKLGYALDFVVLDASDWRENNDFLRRLPMVRQRYPGKPVILTGIGRIVQPGNNNGSLDPISEQGQALFIETNLRLTQRSRIFAGLFVYSFTDYITENSNNFAPLTNTENYMTTGIFDLQRKERPAAGSVRSIFLDEKTKPLITGNKPPSPGFWYIGAALLNLLFFGIVYKNSLRFRENLKRSLGHPFGFFSDIRDRRIIPLSQSIWLAAFISLNGGVFYAALAFQYRLSLISGYALNIFLHEGLIKTILFKLMWSPLLAIVVFSLLLMLFFTLNGVIIRIFALFTRKRIVFRQCISLSYWSAINFILLILPGLFFFTALSFPLIVKWLLIFWIIFHFWFFYRLINSTRILLDVPLSNIFIVFSFLLIFTLLIYTLYMQNSYNFMDYLQLFKTILAEQRW